MTNSFVYKLTALGHLAISLFIAVSTYFVGKMFFAAIISSLMLAWVFFCVTHVGLSWLVFLKSSVKQTKLQASKQDENRTIIFFLVILATFAGLLAVFILLSKTGSQDTLRWVNVALAMFGMVMSWVLVHTIYTSHYAHLFYGSGKPGLSFPKEDEPDFLDFAYYSFVIGMTFQVSDVSTISKQMRRLTLSHSLISFLFNTCIVALTINAVAGLLGG